MFPGLIEDWRSHWGTMCRFSLYSSRDMATTRSSRRIPLADLREAQSMTLALPATGMATAIDIGV